MTAFEIYSAVGGVGEDILEESEIMPKKKITKIIPLMAAAACFAVFAAGLSHALRNDDIEQPVTDISEITTSPASGNSVTESSPPESDQPQTGIIWSDTVTYDVTHPASQITAETDPNAPTETAEMHTEPYPAVTNYEIMPDPFGTVADAGGDENAGFYQPCNYLLDSIPGSLLDLRDSGAVDKWIAKDQIGSRSEVPSSIKDYINIYSFITDFNITREEAETALEYYLNTPEEFEHITYEHLDIIFSGDVALITKTFASEHSIVVGDRIYSPEWLYTHSPDEYRAAGITAEDILSRVGAYCYFHFTDEARQAFSEKLSAYTGEKVVIETVTYEKKDNAYDIQDDVPEDVADDVYDEVVDEEYVPEEYE